MKYFPKINQNKIFSNTSPLHNEIGLLCLWAIQSVCQGLGWQKCQSFHIFAMIVHFWYKIFQHLIYLCILERKLISFQFSWDWFVRLLHQPALQSSPANTGALIGLWAPALLTAALQHRGERREREQVLTQCWLHSGQTAGEIKLPDITGHHQTWVDIWIISNTGNFPHL